MLTIKKSEKDSPVLYFPVMLDVEYFNGRLRPRVFMKSRLCGY